MSTRLLFICSRNQWRSPTAERVFARAYETRSAGTSPNARRRVDERLLRWADVIFVMEKKHRRMLERRFGRGACRQVVVLDIEDAYHFMDEELIARLEDGVRRALEQRL